MKQSDFISPPIFSNEQNHLIENLLQSFDAKQLTWLAGYLTGISQASPLKNGAVKSTSDSTPSQNGHQAVLNGFTVLYGSRTGNGSSIAKQIQAEAEIQGFNVQLQDMNEYPLHKLKDETNLLVIVSTHGEGVPPIAAESFYEFLHGKRAPKLSQTKFSVLALGDSSYLHFCKTGKDIDKRLEELGAERLYPRADCDVDFSLTTAEWIKGVLSTLTEKSGKDAHVKLNGEVKLNGHASTETATFTKQNPFKARLLEKIKLNGKGSGKETYHYEISLEGSSLSYEPGDSIGIYGKNSPRAVNELIEALSFRPEELVETSKGKNTVEHVLTHEYEISSLNPEVLNHYNKHAQDPKLAEILSDNEKLKKYLYGRDLVDVVHDFPAKWEAQHLLQTLRKLQPRLYSISSSYKTHPEEVHLTVCAVRYSNNRYKEGLCSTFLADRIGDDDYVSLYVEKNPEFRLPADPNTPVIMIGPGTGIAPFRAFLEEREATGARGKNWLFFGDRNFTTDFLYQTELLSYHKKGLLSRLNVAFSRDTDQKVYVQHKMLKHSRELFQWLEEGAHFYVCGDMKNMWNDVNKTLLEIIAKEGGITPDKAEDYLKNLKKTKRYLVDVY
jgi:sulfite reductase (NADPH) flavoprotein alpha-component